MNKKQSSSFDEEDIWTCDDNSQWVRLELAKEKIETNLTRKIEKVELTELWRKLKNIHHMGQTGWWTMEKADRIALKSLKEFFKTKE